MISGASSCSSDAQRVSCNRDTGELQQELECIGIAITGMLARPALQRQTFTEKALMWASAVSCIVLPSNKASHA